MIVFTKRSFGYNPTFCTIFVGSAWPKALPASIVAALIYYCMKQYLTEEELHDVALEHPYALGCIFTAIGFLVVFRANHAFARMNEGASWIFHMESRLFDSLIQVQSFHMQTQAWRDSTHESATFLEELWHLHSLVLALACLALRRDDLEHLEGWDEDSMSSVIAFNAANLPWETVTQYRPQNWFKRVHYAWSMRSATQWQTKYHRCHKLEVYGGISEEEVRALDWCANSKTRVELVLQWLTEFITRHQLAGNLGAVPPPIVSRIYQWLSEAGLGFSKALRIVDVPFPFIVAQISEFSMVALVPLIPVLELSFIQESTVMGVLMTFFTCLVFIGLYEAARDVEDPFFFEPNDLPLVAILKRFNEHIAAVKRFQKWPGGFRMKHIPGYFDQERANRVEGRDGAQEPRKSMQVGRPSFVKHRGSIANARTHALPRTTSAPQPAHGPAAAHVRRSFSSPDKGDGPRDRVESGRGAGGSVSSMTGGGGGGGGGTLSPKEGERGGSAEGPGRRGESGEATVQVEGVGPIQKFRRRLSSLQRALGAGGGGEEGAGGLRHRVGGSPLVVDPGVRADATVWAAGDGEGDVGGDVGGIASLIDEKFDGSLHSAETKREGRLQRSLSLGNSDRGGSPNGNL